MKKKINISDKALKLINQKQIKPIPRWEFMINNWLLWSGLVLSFSLLVAGVTVSWFGLIDQIITPNLWVTVSIVFLTISYLLFQKTKKSYRFEKWKVATFIVILGITIGGILFRIGVASWIDRGMELRFTNYRQMVPMRMVVWNNPKAGYLSGEIVKLNNNNDFVIKGFDEKLWIVTGDRPLVRGRVMMKVGETVKLIGSQSGESNFVVKEVRPWNGMGQGMKENR